MSSHKQTNHTNKPTYINPHTNTQTQTMQRSDSGNKYKLVQTAAFCSQYVHRNLS